MRDWLTLSQASDILGIHPTTLRAWVATGEINAFLTPGGHRRFQLADVEAFIARRDSKHRIAETCPSPERALVFFREKLQPTLVQRKTWYRDLDESALRYHRDTGRRLLELLVTYLNRSSEREELLRQVRKLGHSYGIGFKRSHLSLADLVRAFVLFQRMVAEAALRSADPTVVAPIQNSDSDKHVDAFMDELLISIIEGYEAGAKSSGSRIPVAAYRDAPPRPKKRPQAVRV